MAASIADIPTTLECLDSRLKELEFLCEGILPPSKPASSIPMQDTVIHDVKTLHSQTNALINQHELLYNLIQSLNELSLWKYVDEPAEQHRDQSKSVGTVSQHDLPEPSIAASELEVAEQSFTRVIDGLSTLERLAFDSSSSSTASLPQLTPDSANTSVSNGSFSPTLSAPKPIVDLAMWQPSTTTDSSLATQIRHLASQADILAIRSARLMQVLLEDVIVPENEAWVDITAELNEIETQVQRKTAKERENKRYEPVSQVD